MVFKKFLILTILLCCSVNAQLSDKQKEFSSKLEKAMLEGDQKAFLSVFDLNFFNLRIKLRAKPKNDEFYQGFSKGFRAQIGNICNAVSFQAKNSGATYSFLRIIKRRDKDHYIYRFNSPDGINYHEFIVREVDGKLKAMDFYIYITGEFMSQTMAGLYKVAESKFIKKESDEVMDMGQTMIDVKNLMRAGKNKEAFDKLEALPEEAKNVQAVKMIKLTLAAKIDEKLYYGLIEEFNKSAGLQGKGHVLLLKFDFLFLNKKYKELLKCIDQLDEHVGGDPMLDFFRLNAYYTMQNYEKTKEYTKKYIKSFPSEDGYCEIPFSLAISMKDNKNAVDGLKYLKSAGYEIQDLESNQNYKEFTNSPEYKKYKASLATE